MFTSYQLLKEKIMRTFVVHTNDRSVVIPVVNNMLITCGVDDNNDVLSFEILSEKYDHHFTFAKEKNNELACYDDFKLHIHKLNELFLSDEVKSTHVVDLTEFDLKLYDLIINQ